MTAKTMVPRPPDGLGPAGRAAWRRLWTAATWLDLEADWAVMVRYCQGFDERTELRRRIAADGLMVCGSMGQRRAHPALSALRHLDEQLTKYETTLGFTPLGRRRLGVVVAGRASDRIDELARRRARPRPPKTGL